MDLLGFGAAPQPINAVTRPNSKPNSIPNHNPKADLTVRVRVEAIMKMMQNLR